MKVSMSIQVEVLIVNINGDTGNRKYSRGDNYEVTILHQCVTLS